MKIKALLPVIIIGSVLSGCATDMPNYTNEMESYKLTLSKKFYKSTPECGSLRTWNSQAQCSKKILVTTNEKLIGTTNVKEALHTLGEVEKVGTKYFIANYDKKGINKVSENYNVDIKRTANFKMDAIPTDDNRTSFNVNYEYKQDDIDLSYKDSTVFEANKFKVINVSYIESDDTFLIQALKIQ